MWIAVRQRFQAFHVDLMLTEGQVDDGQTKAMGIANCLYNAYYPGMNADPPAFMVGSWGKRTQVRPPNDVDMMFVLPFDVYQRFSQRTGNIQSALLQEVKQVLLSRYSTSTMRGDGQVVQIAFNTLTVEVVPVFGLQNGLFWMPDSNGGGTWKAVHPIAEQLQIQALDAACQGNVRALCQMMKLWKREQKVPLKSFQIELLVQEFMQTYSFRANNYFWYDWLVRDFLQWMTGRVGGYMIVPGTGEYIALGSDWRYKAEQARDFARQACNWEEHDYDITAGQEWQKIFGNRIPIKVI